MTRLDEVMQRKLYRDAKSQLQEKIQELKKLTPTYRLLKETGPDHSGPVLPGWRVCRRRSA